MSKQIESLSSEEYVKLHEALALAVSLEPVNMRPLRNATMMLLMLDAGLRVGEVVKLLQTDLIFRDEPVGSLRIQAHITKTGTSRVVPLTGTIKGAIGRMFEFWESEWDSVKSHYAFYSSVPWKPLTIRQVQRICNMISMNILHRNVHCHVLRHTFATRLMRVTNIRVVQELLGHKAITSTQVYTHPNGQDLAAAIKGIQDPKQE
ncbi:site-specific integrase [Candidatus Pacearchaeota archaeon]|nr:site-specific integrase [Candidatus Pacearchaeota archaeon]